MGDEEKKGEGTNRKKVEKLPSKRGT